jgi:predicted phosphodiesterase
MEKPQTNNGGRMNIKNDVRALMAKGYGYRTISETLDASEYNVRKLMRQIRSETTSPPHYPQEYPEISITARPFNRDKNKLVVVLFDAHIGEISEPLKAAVKFCAANQPDEIILGGDFLDLDAISSHNKGLPGLIKNPLMMDIKRGNAVIERLQIISPTITYLEGNHEDRARKFSAANPETFDGIIDIPALCRLEERGIKWVEYGKLYPVGKANITHGWWCNVHHAKRHVEAAGDNVFYGHTHTVQSHSMTRLSETAPIVGVSCGCLCTLNPSYLRNAPNRWVNAFLILELRPDGTFTPYVPFIINGGFTFAGKDYFA